jgi:fumigallin biosynthesis monooxygenase-like protein
MAEIFNGRYTARTDKPLVLFLIGLRLNKVRAALPVFTAMPRLLAELDRKPESGLRSHRTYMAGRIVLVEQYWDSFDKLMAYTHDASARHFPAWAAFNRVWHESHRASQI